MIPFLQYPWNDKIIEMKNRLVVATCQRQCWGNGGACNITGNSGNPCGDGTVLYLDYIDSKILVVMLYWSFQRRYLWRKLGKGYQASLGTVSENYI